MINITATIEALYYLLDKNGKSEKMKLVKLVFLADKYHLIQYGRTVTGDKYLAMKDGPAGSTVLDILNFNEDYLEDEDIEYSLKFIKKLEGNYLGISNTPVELNTLSESDLEALDFVSKKFGRMSAADLRKYTHEYPEWKQYKELFEKKLTKWENIRTVELLSRIPGDPFEATPEHIEESKKILTGDYE
jgi:uncharacterized phage-associated protein